MIYDRFLVNRENVVMIPFITKHSYLGKQSNQNDVTYSILMKKKNWNAYFYGTIKFLESTIFLNITVIFILPTV